MIRRKFMGKREKLINRLLKKQRYVLDQVIDKLRKDGLI